MYEPNNRLVTFKEEHPLFNGGDDAEFSIHSLSVISAKSLIESTKDLAFIADRIISDNPTEFTASDFENIEIEDCEVAIATSAGVCAISQYIESEALRHLPDEVTIEEYIDVVIDWLNGNMSDTLIVSPTRVTYFLSVYLLSLACE